MRWVKAWVSWPSASLNVQGSTLLFLTLFLFGFTVFTDLSWFRVMDLTGKITLDLLELIQGSVRNWWHSRQAGRVVAVRHAA